MKIGNALLKRGVKHIAEALKQNKTLVSLSLHSNKFGNRGAEYLSEAIKANTALEVLNIECKR